MPLRSQITLELLRQAAEGRAFSLPHEHGHLLVALLLQKYISIVEETPVKLWPVLTDLGREFLLMLEKPGTIQ